MLESEQMKKKEDNQNRTHTHRIDESTSLFVLDEGNINSNYSRLLIQGLGCVAETIWRPLLTQLGLEEDRRHIAFNVRGIGGSSGWPNSIEQMADDAAHVLAELEVSTVEVVGHSLGGVVGMIMAAKYPDLVQSLVLMDSVPAYNEKTRSGFLWRAKQIRSAGTVSAILDTVMPRSFCSKTQVEHPELINVFRAMLTAQNPDVYSHLCYLAATIDVWKFFNSLSLPSLVVVGSEDPSTTPIIMKDVASKLGAHFVEIPNAGHNPPLEQPALVAAALLCQRSKGK